MQKAQTQFSAPPLSSPAVLCFLLQVSFLVDEGVSPVLLQLLSCGLCGSKVLSASASTASSSTSASASSSSGSGQPAGQSKSSTKKSKKEEKEKDREGEPLALGQAGLWGEWAGLWPAAPPAAQVDTASLCLPGEGSSSQEDQLCTALVNQLNKFADKETLVQFLRCFLLESNSSSVRWQAHCLTLHIYRRVSWKCLSGGSGKPGQGALAELGLSLGAALEGVRRKGGGGGAGAAAVLTCLWVSTALQELRQVPTRAAAGPHVVHLAGAPGVRAEGCPVCGFAGLLLLENAADREKGRETLGWVSVCLREPSPLGLCL